jgi:hypothetical protein
MPKLGNNSSTNYVRVRSSGVGDDKSILFGITEYGDAVEYQYTRSKLSIQKTTILNAGIGARIPDTSNMKMLKSPCTSRGVCLGDGLKKVLQVYGRPSKEQIIKEQNVVKLDYMLYSDSDHIEYVLTFVSCEEGVIDMQVSMQGRIS